MSLIPAGFLECTFIFQYTGRPRVSTWSIGFDDGLLADPEPAQDADAFYNEFTDVGRPYHADEMLVGWSFLGTSVTKQTDTGPLIGTHLQTIAGTGAFGPVPINTSLLVNKNTAAGGRRNRGRAFIPPVFPPEDFVNGGGVVDGVRTADLQALYTAAFDALVASDFVFKLFHQTAPFTPTTITGLTVQSQMATQRRRMRS